MRGVLNAAHVILLVQSTSDHPVPVFHLLVWSGWEDLSGDVFREDGSIGARNVPDLDGLLQEADVFLGT